MVDQIYFTVIQICPPFSWMEASALSVDTSMPEPAVKPTIAPQTILKIT